MNEKRTNGLFSKICTCVQRKLQLLMILKKNITYRFVVWKQTDVLISFYFGFKKMTCFGIRITRNDNGIDVVRRLRLVKILRLDSWGWCGSRGDRGRQRRWNAHRDVSRGAILRSLHSESVANPHSVDVQQPSLDFSPVRPPLRRRRFHDSY